MGIVPSPFDSYLVNRSLKTLALRMERHKESALVVAKWLESHPKVIEVMHPGTLNDIALFIQDLSILIILNLYINKYYGTRYNC